MDPRYHRELNMKSVYLKQFRALSFLVPVLLAHHVVTANTCLSDSDQSIAGDLSTLPKTIGNPKATIAKTPFQMGCDTMYVKVGDTTTIYQGSLLHFPPDQFKNRIIKVQGVLKLLGDAGLPVFMAGSRKESAVGIIPGDERWGGIHLDTSGALLIRHTDIVNADTALYLRTMRYALQEARFQRCGVYVLPDRSIKVLDDKEYLNRPDTAGIFAPKKQRAAYSKAPWIWGGAGVAVIGGIVVGVILNSSGNGDKTNPINPGMPIAPDPDFPGKPDPL